MNSSILDRSYLDMGLGQTRYATGDVKNLIESHVSPGLQVQCRKGDRMLKDWKRCDSDHLSKDVMLIFHMKGSLQVPS